MEFIFIAALLALLIFWFFLRKRDDSGRTKQQGATPRPERRASHTSGEYHAVTIRLGRQTCSAVRELSDERFLAADAPRLPLPECDIAAHCECSFAHHKDRRSGKDRRSPFRPGGISAVTGEYEKERRAGGERRRDEDDYF
ncbi:MAG: hypothetical protein V2I25_15670 [Woeseiaceae bacterium]|jgi:hypothetical protein|nr:hypothetical protein [Woeseiaceae bacterium]